MYLLFVWYEGNVDFGTTFHVFNNICLFKHLKNFIGNSCRKSLNVFLFV